MPYNYVIFDFDGTLFDSRIGIVNSVKYALDKLQMVHPSEDVLTSFIGPPLHESFQNHFGLSKDDTTYAVVKLREYYGDKGYMQSKPYEGILAIIKALLNEHKMLGIATAKPTKYARSILVENSWDSYFHSIHGSELKGELFPKEKTIGEVLIDFNPRSLEECVMIGDTIYDIKGAQQHNVDSIAVDYGYGKTRDLKDAGPTHFAHTVEEMSRIIL
tara:strand:+ start:874 stop:1521 length:648 start_codon:yes stop_codon:yes gene_type:complete